MTPNHNPDHDLQIDRVLKAMRNASPPTGMDRRILNTLEARSSLQGVIPSEAKRSRGTPAFQNAGRAKLLRWTPIAAVAVLAIATLITLTAHRHMQPTTATNPTTSTPAQTPATTSVAIQHTRARHTAAPLHIKQLQPTPTEAAQPAEDAQLSHPAPPIPITDQERILLRYARRGHTDDLAQISNESQAAKEQQEKAQFEAFFTPPPIPTGESE